MDPIKEGSEIFNQIHQNIGKDVITDIKEFEEFMKMLLAETKGLVIVDFLDAGNWDRIENFEIDADSNRVFINWHDYRNRGEQEDEKMMRSMVFPCDVYGLCMQFQELRLFKIGDLSVFIFRGFALSPKEVSKVMIKDTTKFKIIDDSDNFSLKTVRQIDNQWQSYDFLNTPIFSTVILPKNIGINASTSKELLFAYNLMYCTDRILKVINDVTTGEEELDFLCEKSNTLRRVMENILKIECCYRYRQINVKKSYSELLLGDLIGLVKEFRSEEQRSNLTIIVRLANELSHDSGKPVTKIKTFELANLVKKYCEALEFDIYSNPNPHFDF